MKKVLFLFACGLRVVTAGAQSSDRTPFLQKTFPLEAVHQVVAETSGGNISVYGEASGDARIEVWIESNHGSGTELSREEIQRLDEQFDLTVGLEGGTLKAIAKHKERVRDWDNSLSISFRIYTPQSVGSSLRTSGGNIELKGLTGAEDFSTSGGNLDLDQLAGKITGRTSGGDVSIKNSKDNIDLQTSGGDMDATDCEGTIRMVTSGGNMRLRGVKGDIHASTSGGDVKGGEIAGELQTRTSGGNIDLQDISCSLTASTSGGNMNVSVRETGKYIDLSNSSGDISLQLPEGKGMDLKISGERVYSGTMHNFQGNTDDKQITGTLNGGGIPVKINGSDGSVHVSFK